MELVLIKEIIQNTLQQKARSLSTLFCVFWATFIMVTLTGIDNGFMEGTISHLLGSNFMSISPLPTTKPYKSHESGRMWELSLEDCDMMLRKFHNDIDCTAPINLPYGYDFTVVSYSVPGKKKQFARYQIAGTTPEYLKFNITGIKCGRYLDQRDMVERRKVCVIGTKVCKQFFGDDEKSALGQSIAVDEVEYTIVGVVYNSCPMLQIQVYIDDAVQIPLSTEQVVYGKENTIDNLCLIMPEPTLPEEKRSQMLNAIKEEHHIHPDDVHALLQLTLEDNCKPIYAIQMGIFIFAWIVGIGTLLTGLIGISNILMINIREKTREIALRCTLGATPFDVMKQVVGECLFLVVSAALLGLFTGILLLLFIDRIVLEGNDSISFVHVDIPTTIGFLVVIILGGLLASINPTKKALAIKAIDALHDE